MRRRDDRPLRLTEAGGVESDFLAASRHGSRETRQGARRIAPRPSPATIPPPTPWAIMDRRAKLLAAPPTAQETAESESARKALLEKLDAIAARLMGAGED